ncbi:conserved hypothetical protein [Perkinsus marinus ATCC 50983]|uniref:Luc7-like protein 3 n=1 Tax=Perkinsus marinus (strain ATCC 50983 / TXsc) TaxID=423536 RepID=C5L6I4_PERM5|nr:conserved hypothetical protein [Perkinsus marinus ATCC 50983]EER07645.1 conserved hypothetical protein [Perkinsus marinus ATCC 50983]|eukprot:XP_002775829.1 conserved hypothetical protein [Perkinsus marinus ATCC 50983]
MIQPFVDRPFVYAGTKSKRRNAAPHLRKWGPFYCVVLATVGVMADLTRHVLLDSNNWFMTDSKTGKVVKFHFNDCSYEVEKVNGITDSCPDVGLGPLYVTEENALGVDVPMYNPDGSYSVYGIWLTLFATWAGFILMFVGIAWYERKLLSYCEYMETQLAQKIRRGKARVATEIPDIEVPAQNKAKIDELRSKINGLVKEAEGLAERGRLIDSEKKMAQIEPLNDKIRDLSGEKYLHMTRTELVCDVCGCLVTLNENDAHMTLENHEHARGKQHQGWAKIKETSKALREKFASARGMPLSPPTREAPTMEKTPNERRSPTRSGNKEVEENLKETRNGPDANERKSGESQSKVEDWRTHLSKMRRSPLDCIHRALLGVRVGVSTIG